MTTGDNKPRGYPPPPVTPRRDGVTLFGWCGHGTGCNADCNLVAQRLKDGSVRLAYHGTTNHSMILDFNQQLALANMLAVTQQELEQQESRSQPSQGGQQSSST
jgi:hypothetical protein